jgi:hypothetical protein
VDSDSGRGDNLVGNMMDTPFTHSDSLMLSTGSSKQVNQWKTADVQEQRRTPFRSNGHGNRRDLPELVTMQPLQDSRKQAHQSVLCYPSPPLVTPIQTSPKKTSDFSMETRLDYVMERAQRVGFGDFDSIVTAYYTAPFSETSMLFNDQRLSRKRCLPQLLTKLRENSEKWTEWERKSFHEELVRDAEGILADECNAFRQSNWFREWSSREADENRSIHGTQRVLQEKVSSCPFTPHSSSRILHKANVTT